MMRTILFKHQTVIYISIFFFIFCTGLIFPLSALQKQLTIGPEICYVKRTREGGTHQTGTLYGIRSSFDRCLERYRYYYGLEGSYDSGVLKGKSRQGAPLKSNFTQSNIEGRLGYTFQSKGEQYLSFTPYFSAGYFLELNDYKKPSPVQVHFKNQFYYGGMGCILKGCLRPRLHFGLNVQARFSVDGKVRTSHDPDYDPATLKYMQKVQCRVSLPFSYQFSESNPRFTFDGVPFFEYRQYGKKRAIPFDFLDTRIQCWGIDLMLSIKF
jgi:hypothetical protein